LVETKKKRVLVSAEDSIRLEICNIHILRGVSLGKSTQIGHDGPRARFSVDLDHGIGDRCAAVGATGSPQHGIQSAVQEDDVGHTLRVFRRITALR
jgi:hypothetical protein